MNVPKGRKDIAELFYNCLNNDMLSQAYILNGEEGMGKKTVMEYILSLIMCDNHSSCGKCSSCKSITANTHPDVVRLVRPDGRASVGVDSVRGIMNEIYIKPAASRYKAVVVNEAHLLTPEAQNAMLKVIEEPPENVIFFLLCDTTAFILPTIISRSIVINLKPLPRETLKEIGGEKVTDFELEYSQGNPGRLLRLLDDNKFVDLRDGAIDAFAGIASDDGYSVYRAFSYIEKNKESLNEIIIVILFFVRDVLYKKLNMQDRIINKDKINQINAFGANVDERICYEIIKTVLDMQLEKGKNGNFTIAVTMMLLKCREEINGRCNGNQI